MRSVDPRKAVSDLREDIVAELQHEDVAVQIRVAVEVLVAVILNGFNQDPEETRVALAELQHTMKMA